jgi:hypothetical protein
VGGGRGGAAWRGGAWGVGVEGGGGLEWGWGWVEWGWGVELSKVFEAPLLRLLLRYPLHSD